MASPFSQFSSNGFYNTPVSKSLMAHMLMSCAVLNVPSLFHLQKYIICKLPDALYKGEVARILISRCAVLDPKDLVFGSLLIYYFRIFERRYGSHKFANYLVSCHVLSMLLELMVVYGLTLSSQDFHDGFIPPGMYGIIFSMFVNYYYDVPRVTQATFLGIPITGKTVTYIFGLQLCSSPASFVSAFCGITAGFLHRFNFCKIQKVKWIPDWFARLSERIFKPLLSSTAPEEGPIGATLELQRQEQMDLWEQQMMMNRGGDFDVPPMANGDVPGFMRNIMGNRREANPTPPPSEDQIQTLIEMGFERQRVIEALRSSRNDVNEATHVLLQRT